MERKQDPNQDNVKHLNSKDLTSKDRISNAPTEKRGITPKQKKVLEFIEEYSRENTYAPSQKEIAEYFGYASLGTVQNYLVRLERQGYLKKSWNAKRSMQVIPTLELGTQSTTISLLGRVAAGRPIEAIENNDTLDVPSSMLLGSGDHFALKVVGDSMEEEGIIEDDFIIVQQQVRATNGQTVVALIDNETTVKKFYRKNGNIELHPANVNYQPIILKEREGMDFKILGIVVGVIRKYH